jgi:uncharacterized protein YbjT (DUF2867 family)
MTGAALSFFLLYLVVVSAFHPRRIANRRTTMMMTGSKEIEGGLPKIPLTDQNRAERALLGVSRVASASLFGGMASGALLPQRASAEGAGSRGPVVVLGSNGQTGKLIVNLLSKAEIAVQPTFARTPPADAPKGSTILEAKVADVTNPESLSEAVKGASAVIFASSASKKGGNAEKVDYLGVKNTADACLKEKVPQLVVISSGAVTRPKSLGFKITNLFGGIMGFKLQGEDELRSLYASSDLSYAIIRPGGLLGGPASGASKMELNQADTISGEINRADVAEVAVAAATSKVLKGKKVTFEIYEGGKSGPLEDSLPKTSGYEQRGDSYDAMFANLKEGIDRI